MPIQSRRLLVSGVLLMVSSACAPSLPSHVHLVSSSPAADGVFGTSPTRLEIRFAEAVAPGQSSAEVLDEAGASVSGTSAVDAADPRALVADIEPGLAPGRYTVRWRGAVAGEQQALDGGFTFAVEAGAPPHPRLLLSRDQADANEEITVAGTGFTPLAPIALGIADDDEAWATASGDAHGAFSVRVTIPNDVPFGQQPVFARDATGARASTDLDVRWGGWPPLRVFTSGQPGPQPNQVTFTVTGRNRSDYVLEGIRVFLQIPPGATPLSASAGGRREGDDLVWDSASVDRTFIEPRTMTVRVQGPVQSRARLEFRHRRPRGCVGSACLPSFVDETVSQSSVIRPDQ